MGSKSNYLCMHRQKGIYHRKLVHTYTLKLVGQQRTSSVRCLLTYICSTHQTKLNSCFDSGVMHHVVKSIAWFVTWQVFSNINSSSELTMFRITLTMLLRRTIVWLQVKKKFGTWSAQIMHFMTLKTAIRVTHVFWTLQVISSCAIEW